MNAYNKKLLLATGIPAVILIGVSLLLLNYYSKQLKIEDTENKVETPAQEDRKIIANMGCSALEEPGPIEYYKGEPAAVRYADFEDAIEFKTVIEASIKEGANFAGKYRVAEWGCGTACQNTAVIDLKTGNIVAFGLLSDLGSEYSLDKTFLTLNPLERIKQDPMFQDLESETYRVDTEEDKLLFQCKATLTPPTNQICAQVLVDAKNDATGETRAFSTPCAVPRNNWMKLAPSTIVE